MTRALPLLVAILMFGEPQSALAQMIIVFVDGTRMEIQSYEVKEGLVLFKTREGKLRSVPRSYVNLVATEQANRGGGTTSSPPARTTPPPRPTPAAPKPSPSRPAELPSESVEPEPQVIAPATPAPAPIPPPAPPRAANLPTSPPPVWSNEELQVSLVVPSSQWVLEEMPPSFDVAAALANASTEGRATLALIRQKIRGEKDFRNVVQDVEQSISRAPGFRLILDDSVTLDPYEAHEFRFVKDAGFVPVYNRLVVVYSRDLAYVLSLTCPETRARENEADFDALVRGLVIKKSRKDLSF